MAEQLTLKDRIKEARFLVAAKLRESVAPARMAALVAEQLGRGLHETQWRRYESGESEPPLDVIRVTARLSGLTESYIAFGVVDAAAEQLPDPRAQQNDNKKGA